MPHDPKDERDTSWRKYMLYSWLVVFVIGVLYVAWTFHSRRERDRAIEQKALEKQRVDDRRNFEMMGGDRFEILQFYATPGAIRRGESAQLCYGVSNAKTVRLDPPAGRVWPSLSRCVDVSPARDTTYTLTIEDAQGNSRTQTVTLRVR